MNTETRKLGLVFYVMILSASAQGQGSYKVNCSADYELVTTRSKISMGPEYKKMFSRRQLREKALPIRFKEELTELEINFKTLDTVGYDEDYSNYSIINRFKGQLERRKKFTLTTIGQELVKEEGAVSANLNKLPILARQDHEKSATFRSSKQLPDFTVVLSEKGPYYFGPMPLRDQAEDDFGYQGKDDLGYWTGDVNGPYTYPEALYPHLSRVFSYSIFVENFKDGYVINNIPGTNPTVSLKHNLPHKIQSSPIGLHIANHSYSEDSYATRISRNCSPKDYKRNLPWYTGQEGRILRFEHMEDKKCLKAYRDAERMGDLENGNGIIMLKKLEPNTSYSVNELKDIESEVQVLDRWELDAKEEILTIKRIKVTPRCNIIHRDT